MSDVDDEAPALDSLPEDPPDKQERWRGISSGVALEELGVPPTRAGGMERELIVQRLELAAIRYRDAQLAQKQALAEYQAALDAFNKFVAPVTTKP